MAVRPLNQRERSDIAEYERIKRLKQALITCGVMYANAIRYCGYNGNYASNLARLYNQRKARFYDAANAYIAEYGNAYVF